jgi:hypothetical protein
MARDQTIEFSGTLTAKKCPIPLRRIGYRYRYQQKCCHDSDLGCNMRLSASGIPKIPVETQEKSTANTSFIAAQPV